MKHLPPTHDPHADHRLAEEAERLTKGKRTLHLPPWMERPVEERAKENREEGPEDEEPEIG